MNFVEAPAGYRCGIYSDPNYVVHRWNVPFVEVYFSSTRKGGSMFCHLASDKTGLRLLKDAISEYTEYLFTRYPWCTMVIATVNRKSLARLLEKCGFERIKPIGSGYVYVRLKEWVL